MLPYFSILWSNYEFLIWLFLINLSNVQIDSLFSTWTCIQPCIQLIVLLSNKTSNIFIYPLPTAFAFSFNLTLVLHAPSFFIGIGSPKTISWSCVYQSSRFFYYFSKQFFLPIDAGRRFFQQEREEKCKHSAFWDVRVCVWVLCCWNAVLPFFLVSPSIFRAGLVNLFSNAKKKVVPTTNAGCLHSFFSVWVEKQ